MNYLRLLSPTLSVETCECKRAWPLQVLAVVGGGPFTRRTSTRWTGTGVPGDIVSVAIDSTKDLGLVTRWAFRSFGLMRALLANRSASFRCQVASSKAFFMVSALISLAVGLRASEVMSAIEFSGDQRAWVRYVLVLRPLLA